MKFNGFFRAFVLYVVLIAGFYCSAQDPFAGDSAIEAELKNPSSPPPRPPTTEHLPTAEHLPTTEPLNQPTTIRQRSDGPISGGRHTVEPEVIYYPDQNRFPEQQPLFVKPKGPREGGKLRVPHPNAVKGLVRIENDGSYLYKTKTFDKSKAGSFRYSQIDAPKIVSANNSSVNFSTIYGSKKVSGFLFDYEWQPLNLFGRLGLQLGFGLYTVKGNGTFKTETSQGGEVLARAEEVYNLYMFPLSLFGIYRFEYARNQWIVPFVNAGLTYYALAEIRDDGKKQNFNGAPAAGGGGGAHFSISALDRQKAFTMGQEYGIGDLWFTVEARV